MIQIPLKEYPDFRFRAELEGYLFTFRFRWRPNQLIWLVDLSCDDLDIAVAGLACVTGFDLLHGRGLYQLGALYLVDLQGMEDPTTFEGFGDRWKLYYETRAERDDA